MFKSKLNFIFDEDALPGELVIFLVESEEENISSLVAQLQADEDLRSEWLIGNRLHEETI